MQHNSLGNGAFGGNLPTALCSPFVSCLPYPTNHFTTCDSIKKFLWHSFIPLRIVVTKCLDLKVLRVPAPTMYHASELLGFSCIHMLKTRTEFIIRDLTQPVLILTMVS
jgi:hypothetical protein